MKNIISRYIPSELQIFSSILERMPELNPRGVVACKDTNLSYISIESEERVSSLELSLKLLAFIQNSTRALSDRPFFEKKKNRFTMKNFRQNTLLHTFVF